jgi:hypothetical protein
MTIELNISLVLAVLAVCLTVYGLWKERALIVIPSAIVAAATLIYRHATDPETIAEEAARAEAERRAAIPHVIRQADGCKVYTWKGGGQWHYFTRCSPADTVTTERSYTEKVSCGKNCTKHVPRKEVIVTEPAA